MVSYRRGPLVKASVAIIPGVADKELWNCNYEGHHRVRRRRNPSSGPDPCCGAGDVRIGARAQLSPQTGKRAGRWDGGGMAPAETPRERRHRLMNDVFDEIRATRSGFNSAENVPHEVLYERRAVR